MRLLGSPTYLSCYRFYGNVVGVCPNAQKHVVNRWSLCRIAPRFRLVINGGRCPQSLRVPRVLVCSSRQLYRQPAPRRPLPRRGCKENTKKTAFRAVCVWFWPCFLVVYNVFLDTEKHRVLMRVKKNAVRSWLNRNGSLNLELFKFAPDKNQPLAKRSPPRHHSWACAFMGACRPTPKNRRPK